MGRRFGKGLAELRFAGEFVTSSQGGRVPYVTGLWIQSPGRNWVGDTDSGKSRKSTARVCGRGAEGRGQNQASEGREED